MGKVDDLYLDKFFKTIEFKDGHYMVEIPWYEDIIKYVPSNHKIALATHFRVDNKLKQQGLLNDYLEVFEEYEREGIIEEVKVDVSNYENLTWVPHRPIIKTAEQTKTKIRPVFNCSFKRGDLPSLNMACYPGVDLMASLFKLLLQFRSNQFIIVGDIRKAFLQIRLKLESDRNRFCFFLIKNGQIKTYRYTSILFGLAVSPFILSAITRWHSYKYPPDISSKVMRENMYVDDLIYSSSSYEEMREVYETTTQRMREGGFDLCNWNSNHPTLKSLMQRDGKLSPNSLEVGRVLGIQFDTAQDTIRLNDVECGTVSTKRDLLSAISKIFDPLSLYAPVTIRGRILMRQTWEGKLGWDSPISAELLAKWEKLHSDILLLKNISFNRMSFDTDDSNLTLNIFADASVLSYGFSVYVTGVKTKPYILMAKNKVAPVKGRTLPQLELLAVFLALKCLPQILSTFSGVKFIGINIFSDSTITLAWINNKT